MYPSRYTNLLLVSKFLSNGLKVQYHVNKNIVGGANIDMVAIAQCEGEVYQMTFRKVCGQFHVFMYMRR